MIENESITARESPMTPNKVMLKIIDGTIIINGISKVNTPVTFSVF